MKRFGWVLSWLICVAMVAPAVAEHGPYAITAAQVADAIARTGMRVSPGQVTLLSDVVAASSSPVLQVKSMNVDGNNRATVRLACAQPSECLPFIVGIRLSVNGGAPASAQEVAYSPAPAAPVQRVPEGPVVRWGSKAVLLIVAPHMEIKVPVICLESGSVGQTIRVTSPDHRETYNARVVSGDLLRGSL